MKKILLSLFTLFSLHAAAEDGHQLWLRYQPVHLTNVSCDLQSPTIDIVRQELQTYYKGRDITLRLDASMPDDDGFRFDGTTLTATTRQDCSTEPMPCYAARTGSHIPLAPCAC